jgi:hypothetical protein
MVKILYRIMSRSLGTYCVCALRLTYCFGLQEDISTCTTQGRLDPDPHWESMTYKNKERRNFMLLVLDILFCELKATPVASTSFLEAQG